MTEFTLSPEARTVLLAGANTQEEVAAITQMVEESRAIDQLLLLQDWRKQTLKFIPHLQKLEAEMALLSGNAGLLTSSAIKSLRTKLSAIRADLGLGDEDAEDDGDDEAAEQPDVALAGDGPMPQSATASGKFETFFAQNLPNVTFFSPSEFLYKGAAHEQNGLNVDPPKVLWPNMLPLARTLNQLRAEVGAPVRLTSIYRGSAYNAAIGGAVKSQHKKFKAADFVCSAETPADLAQRLRNIRSSGAFSGGIGTYSSFVHVDVRGTNADWNG